MVNELINECKETLQDNLVSVIKFGTEGEKNNVLIVTKTLKFRDLEKIKPIINKYSKRTTNKKTKKLTFFIHQLLYQ